MAEKLEHKQSAISLKVKMELLNAVDEKADQKQTSVKSFESLTQHCQRL